MKLSFFLRLTLLNLAIYLGFALWFPLWKDPGQIPLPDIYSFTASWPGLVGYAGCLLALFGLLWWFYDRVRQGVLVPRWQWLFVTAALFCLPLLLTFPINATDLHRYYLSGRVAAVHGQSPFSISLGVFERAPYHDSFMALGGEWIDVTTPYGPAWELIAGLITWIAGDHLLLALVLLKGLGAACHLAVGFLIWSLLRSAEPAERLARTLLWLWNPALLLILVVDGHNDGWMLLWLLLGVWLLQRAESRDRGMLPRAAALSVMALAVLSKPIALLPLAVFYVATLRRVPSWGGRFKLTLLAGLGGVLLAVATFAPYAALDATPGGSVISFVQRLASEASGSGGFSVTSLLALLAFDWQLPLTIPELLRVAAILFVFFAAWLLWRTWRGRPAWRSAADMVIGYLVEAFKFRIWYAAWAFPWFLLDRSGGDQRLAYGVAFLLTSQLSVLIYGHLRHWGVMPNWTWAHVVAVPFVFLLPLVAGRWAKRSSRNRPEIAD